MLAEPMIEREAALNTLDRTMVATIAAGGENRIEIELDEIAGDADIVGLATAGFV